MHMVSRCVKAPESMSVRAAIRVVVTVLGLLRPATMSGAQAQMVGILAVFESLEVRVAVECPVALADALHVGPAPAEAYLRCRID